MFMSQRGEKFLHSPLIHNYAIFLPSIYYSQFKQRIKYKISVKNETVGGNAVELITDGSPYGSLAVFIPELNPPLEGGSALIITSSMR